jgi:hypothetical protein
VARSTVFRYKGRDVDAQRVGLELNVRAVMTGRVQRVRDHFSIAAELVDVTDGAQLWGEQYTRELSEMLSLQQEISSDIGEKLRLKLSSGDKRRLARQHTKSAAAYELYLKGRYYWSKWEDPNDPFGAGTAALVRKMNLRLLGDKDNFITPVLDMVARVDDFNMHELLEWTKLFIRVHFGDPEPELVPGDYEDFSGTNRHASGDRQD